MNPDRTQSPDIRATFALRMGIAARLWRKVSDDLAAASGFEGCNLIPLYHLAKQPSGLTQVELSRQMKVSESSIVRILRPLSERGLVCRTRMIGDARAWLIKLECAGFTAMDAFESRAATLRHSLFLDMSDADILRASNLLLALTERLSDYDDLDSCG